MVKGILKTKKLKGSLIWGICLSHLVTEMDRKPAPLITASEGAGAYLIRQEMIWWTLH
jgi:hypothetical protein